MSDKLITTEYVSYGHPDKIADQISDAIVDAFMNIDENSRVAVETMVKDNIVVLGGEVTSNGSIGYDEVVRGVVKNIGYNKGSGFHYSEIKIINLIGKQSTEINIGVDGGETIGSGDQGIMFGYSTNQTPTMMPIGIYAAKTILKFLTDQSMIELGPDAKCQITIREGVGFIIETILISTMHQYGIDLIDLRSRLKSWVTSNKVLNQLGLADIRLADDVKILINPIGEWRVGGPISDCGITGRKIVVDQYGPYSPVGGGAFSGKDYTKTDRTGAYLSRYIANAMVLSGWFKTCWIKLAYVIGESKPLHIEIRGIDEMNIFEHLSPSITDKIIKNFPIELNQVVDVLRLKDVPYGELAKNGHFGTDVGDEFGLKWETVDDKLIDKLKNIKKAL